ncbi:MAG: hypothetical protein NVSMB14_06620 [Isosphaeraceae bacterium]
MIRAVIFDFNGLLVDDESLHFDLFREALGEEGIALSEKDYHERYLGYDDRGCFAEALRDAGRSADDATVEELIARKAGRYQEKAREGLRIFPGAAEAMKSLGSRWPIAICSGALRNEILFALRLMGVADWPTALIAAEDVVNCKPDP